MNFASDNTTGASSPVLEAIIRANAEILPSYGADEHTARAKGALAEAFGRDLVVTFVATGTAANALALSALVPPGGVVFCHAAAHIIEEECAAPEFFIGGGKLVGVSGANGKVDPDAFRSMLRRFPRGVARQAQPACLSLSQATESGTLYTPDELRTLAGMAHQAGLSVHMDGARFANAVAAFGCAPAALSHEAGVDILSLGATKNGTLACEAVLMFDKNRAERLPALQKRAGHVLSKGRFFGAQMTAHLQNGHWLDLARHANAMAKRLADGFLVSGWIRLPWFCQANEVFAVMPRVVGAALTAAGARFNEWEVDYLADSERPRGDEIFARFVCSFATTVEEIDSAVMIAQAGAGAPGR